MGVDSHSGIPITVTNSGYRPIYSLNRQMEKSRFSRESLA